MPTYEYECRKCGHQFERFQSILAEPVKTCPKCKGKVARMMSTGGGIIFKGSGFYQTDYKKTAHAPPAVEKGGHQKPEAVQADGAKPAGAKKQSPQADKPSK